MLVDLRRPAAVLGGLLAVTVAGLMAFACSGGGDQSGDEVDAEAQALLEQMVLGEQDLPPGLAQVSVTFSTNEDIAEEFSDPEAELAKLERWGRRLGHAIAFAPAPDAPPDLEVQGLENTVSLFRTAQGASDSFTEGVEIARDLDWPALYPDLHELEVEEIERPGLGDEAVWFRISGLDGSSRLLADHQVAFRVGTVRSFLRVVTLFDAGTGRDAYQDQVETWARLVAERVAAALAAADTVATPSS